VPGGFTQEAPRDELPAWATALGRAAAASAGTDDAAPASAAASAEALEPFTAKARPDPPAGAGAGAGAAAGAAAGAGGGAICFICRRKFGCAPRRPRPRPARGGVTALCAGRRSFWPSTKSSPTSTSRLRAPRPAGGAPRAALTARAALRGAESGGAAPQGDPGHQADGPLRSPEAGRSGAALPRRAAPAPARCVTGAAPAGEGGAARERPPRPQAGNVTAPLGVT
jgi:hypothetical protein